MKNKVDPATYKELKPNKISIYHSHELFFLFMNYIIALTQKEGSIKYMLSIDSVY